MKKRTKISLVLSSAAAILLAGSIMAGGTYALFTSESKTNIAVNSGKVDVSATIDGLTTYTGEDLTGVVEDDESKIKPSTEYESLQNGQFMNGGTASYDEVSNTLTLDKMTPGDKVTFNIKLANNDSNVAAKYRTIISCEEDDGLLSGLEFTIDGTKFDGLNNKSTWTELSSDFSKTLNCVVSLPSNAGNEYQDKLCKVSYKIEAVQGNAVTKDTPANTIEIDNAAQLGCFRDSINKEEYSKYIGKTVTLTNDIDLDGAEWTPIKLALPADRGTITFDGNNKTVSNFKVDVGTDGTKAAGFFSYFNCSILKNFKIDKAQIYGTNHVGAVAGHVLCGTIDNCHVTNSSIVTSTWKDPREVNLSNPEGWNDGDKAGAIVGYLSAESGAHVSGSSATDCTVKGYRDIGGLVGYLGTDSGSTYSTAYVTGNTLNNITIINDRSNNYKSYTTDAEFDVHEVVGEQAILNGKTEPLSLVDSNTVETVTTKIILSDGFTKVSDSVYEISNANGFDYWASSINNDRTSYANATIKLTADIDYTGRDFTPIDLYVNGVSHSNMVFDGCNFTISNIKIVDHTGGHNLGIFKAVASAITIQNVTFDKIIVDGRSLAGESLKNFVGIVMGCTYSKSIFENVKVTNSEVYGYGKIGILIGCSADPGNSLFFKDCTLSKNTICGEYNMGCLIGLYQRNTTTNKEYVTIDNVSITDITVKSNRVNASFGEPIELNATITCEENVKQNKPTCLGHGETISGQYAYYNRCYWGFYAEYYVSYGISSHDCNAVYNSTNILIANSEKIVNSTNHTNPDTTV